MNFKYAGYEVQKTAYGKVTLLWMLWIVSTFRRKLLTYFYAIKYWGSRFARNACGSTCLLVCTASRLSTMMTSLIAPGCFSLNVGVLFAVTLNSPLQNWDLTRVFAWSLVSACMIPWRPSTCLWYSFHKRSCYRLVVVSSVFLYTRCLDAEAVTLPPRVAYMSNLALF